LLRLRALQFQRRDEDLLEAQLRQRRKREEGKEYFDEIRQIRSQSIGIGDLVLLHNTQREKDMTRLNKLSFKWLGPYRVINANLEMGSYVLAEVDGAELGGTVAGNRLKLFHPRPEGFSVSGITEGNSESEGSGADENEQRRNGHAQGTSILEDPGGHAPVHRDGQPLRRSRIEVRI
jgi:hypothetical protein